MKAEPDLNRITLHDHLAHLKEYWLAVYGFAPSMIYEGPYIIKNIKGTYKKYKKSFPRLLYEAFFKYYMLGFKPSEYFEYQLYKNDYKTYVPMMELIKGSKINRMAGDLLASKYLFKKKLLENNISAPKLIAFYNHKGKKITHYKKPDNKKVIIKPDTGGGGRGIKILESDNYEESLKSMNRDYIVEEYIKQHSFLNNIFPGAVNSIRILTVKEKNNYKFLKSVLRTGRNTSKGVDNFSQGGLSIKIDTETGVLKHGKTHFKHGDLEHKTHPDTGFNFYNKKIPFYDEIKKLSISAHKHFPMFGIVGWDIAITKKGPVIIEGNRIPGLFVYQIHEGMKPYLIDTVYYTET